ncbi:valine--tRNA ligase [bacterium]|nr:valine--tRNA ligase [bacterium]MBU1615143.1 valine--tRNA ligase [bacterium]
MNTDIPKAYDPHQTEEKWYRYWQEKGYFKADNTVGGKPYSIVIPPPNVTGSLHMGHALNNTLQDILIRWRKMQGYNVLWLPGTDHAGIATQNVVERQIAKEGMARHDLGREAFIERVWMWKEEYGNRIIGQLKRLGASCDWSRLRFTMDAGLSKAVREVFVRLYEEGLIYQGDYIINWCPRCHTALSDIEVEHQDLNGYLYYLRYPLKLKAQSSKLKAITVATTRPETMLGDTAVAVNPTDERYKDLIGRKVILPIVGREIPIIGDDFVRLEFGTGAVKVTPAHDPNDFEMGKRHDLAFINVLSPDGRMNEQAGPYANMDRYECRSQLIEDLGRQDLLEKTEDYSHAVGHCYRCHTVIEPYLSKQWFVRMKELARPAIKAVKEGRTEFIPKHWEKTYFDWMENIKDWCISRQIWWGHRIPVWYCKDCGETLVLREDPTNCKCGSSSIEQDSDVLDTWFSSALWPFSTLGWPDKTRDLEVYYPTSVLSTSFDIIFFWVARMMIMGLKFMDEVPFKKVYIHALIRDEKGQKMSKSKGNVVDPLDIIKDYGTDALRFTLSALSAQGRDIFLSKEQIEGYRHFANKIWNAARFILMNLEGMRNAECGMRNVELADRWIVSRLNQVTKEVTISLEEFKFNEAAMALYDFVWHEFCDWYLELAKIWLYGEDEEKRQATQHLLTTTFGNILKMLHPFMPFMTEEIWQKLPVVKEQESIILESWPKAEEDRIDEKAIKDMELVREVIYRIRNLRAEMGIPQNTRAKVLIKGESSALRENQDYILRLASLSLIEMGEDMAKPPLSATAVTGGLEIHLPLGDLIDLEAEKARLAKELKKIEEDLSRIQTKLANEAFRAKAPKEVVEKQEEVASKIREKRTKLKENLEILKGGE